MNDHPKPLSREFAIRFILHILEQAEIKKGWGSVQILFQNGVIKTIRKEETIITEDK